MATAISSRPSVIFLWPAVPGVHSNASLPESSGRHFRVPTFARSEGTLRCLRKDIRAHPSGPSLRDVKNRSRRFLLVTIYTLSVRWPR